MFPALLLHAREENGAGLGHGNRHLGVHETGEAQGLQVKGLDRGVDGLELGLAVGRLCQDACRDVVVGAGSRSEQQSFGLRRGVSPCGILEALGFVRTDVGENGDGDEASLIVLWISQLDISCKGREVIPYRQSP